MTWEALLFLYTINTLFGVTSDYKVPGEAYFRFVLFCLILTRPYAMLCRELYRKFFVWFPKEPIWSLLLKREKARRTLLFQIQHGGPDEFEVFWIIWNERRDREVSVQRESRVKWHAWQHLASILKWPFGSEYLNNRRRSRGTVILFFSKASSISVTFLLTISSVMLLVYCVSMLDTIYLCVCYLKNSVYSDYFKNVLSCVEKM